MGLGRTKTTSSSSCVVSLSESSDLMFQLLQGAGDFPE